MSIQSNTHKGSVLQIVPGSQYYPGCLVIVDERRRWGVQAYIPTPAGRVYVRVSWDDLAYIGEAAFEIEDGLS